jgi:hypothetical protein
MVPIQAYCPYCKKTVAVLPILSEAYFWLAVDRNAEVEVMHRPENKGDPLETHQSREGESVQDEAVRFAGRRGRVRHESGLTRKAQSN